MNIYAKKGDKVICVKTECGFNDPQGINPLDVGEIYTVNHTDVGSFMTLVYLEEFPKRCFNSVLFEDVKE